MTDTLLTLDEAGRRIGRSVETMRYWRRLGQGPRTFKLGRRVVVAESDLVDWINQQRAGAS
ncbi:helix-turn-helix transcriptional regulator [Pseudonocardia sp. RS010]|uniref:helix-turn-helix transcriptional regulator n=1 Tax=Pseudonocardia sp. RS010 TaxID=3385979 RepID=UPI00399FE829